MARLIGDAYIVIYPQGDLFGPQAEAIVKKGLAALKPTVNVTPRLDKTGVARVEADLAAAKANLDVYASLSAESAAKIHAQLNALTTDLSIGTKIDPAQLAAAKASLDAYLERNLVSVPVGAKINPASLASAKASLDAYLKGVGAADVGVRLDPASLASAKASLDAYLHAQDIPLEVNTTQAVTRLEELEADTSVLQTRLMNLRAEVNDVGAEAKIAALQVQAAAFARTLASAGSAADFGSLEAKLLGMQAAYGKLITEQEAEDEELKRQAGFWASLGLQGPGSLIHITDILNASLPPVKLYGGAIGDMYAAVKGGDAVLPTLANHLFNVASSSHLTTEAAIEFLAIWGPAAIAVTAFGLAATPTVIAIGKQLQNMNTAAKGTGQSFQSLATQGQSVTAAVKPAVLELFGEGLEALKNDSGTLAPILKTLGAGFDQLGAQAVVAFGNGGSGGIFKSGSADALALANSFTSLGSIMGTFFKLVPGYAEVLLGFGNDVLGATSSVLKFIEPALKIGIALHGAVFYGGLFGTAVSAGIGKLAPAAASAALKLATLTEGFPLASNAALKLGGVMEKVSSGPVLAGIGLLVGAIAAVYIGLKAANDSASAFNKSIQGTVQSSTVLNLQRTLTAALTETTVQYVGAQKQLTTAVSAATAVQNQAVFAGRAGVIGNTAQGQAVMKAAQATNEYRGAVVQLTTQQTNVNSNLQALASTFHTTIPGAIAIANGAQITSNQLTASGANNWATIKAQAGGYAAQLSVMTAGTGELNQALNALTVTQSAQVTDAQKLAQAYTSWIGIVTGGDTAFTSFEQGQSTLNDELKAGSAAGVKLTTSSGKLTEQQKLLGTALVGTSTSALAARQAFDAQVTSATSLYGALQTMAAASGDTASAQVALGKSGKDLVAQLLPMAAGSKEATAEVYALAQIAGYTGPDSFASLTKWLGNTKNAEDDLNTQQTILTLSTANLTAAAKNLSTAVSQEITQAEAAAIAKTEDFSNETLKLAGAISQSQGAASSAVTTYAGQFYSSLIKAGDGSKDAKDQVDAFLTQLGAAPSTIQAVNASLDTLTPALTTGVKAAQNLAAATQANKTAFAQLAPNLNFSATEFDQLFPLISKTDTEMVNNTSSANTAKDAFISFAENGLNLTKTSAQQLWNTQNAQNLTSLAGKAGTTEGSFVSLAKNGLNLTTTQAQQLWSTLRLQYLDTLVTKGKGAEGQFIALAKSGLDLTTSQATALWNTLRQQYLDTLAAKAGETQTAFEKTAGQLGLTKAAADKLWSSLHTLAAGSPYTTYVRTTVVGAGEIKAIQQGVGATGGTSVSTIIADLQFQAAGGIVRGTVPGSSSNGKDNKLAAVKSGELIIPSQHAPKFADMARKASIPGFASGGVVPSTFAGIGAGAAATPAIETAASSQMEQAAVAAFSTFANTAFQAAAAAAAAAVGVSGNVTAYEPTVIAVMKMLDIPLADLNAILKQMQTESGGNPLAVNRSDSNAAAGTPSTGLMQVIAPTFDAYAGPFRNTGPFLNGVSTNAEANIYAGLNYAVHRYGVGNLASVLGQGHGYSAGGMVSEPVFGYGKFSGMPYSFAERGSEYVGPISGSGTASAGAPGMSTYQAATLIGLMQQQNKLLAAMPYSQAQAINQANATGVRRGYFATSGL